MGGPAPFQVQFTSGKGLLDARALWASVVGPHRLALASKRSVILRVDQSVEIYKNIASADAYVFIGVALPVNAGTNPLRIVAGEDSESLGFNNGTPQILNSQMGGGGYGASGFMQLLQPGEQLYAQINEPGFAGTQSVVVAAVTF